jgi:hypothetical protein
MSTKKLIALRNAWESLPEEVKRERIKELIVLNSMLIPVMEKIGNLTDNPEIQEHQLYESGIEFQRRINNYIKTVLKIEDSKTDPFQYDENGKKIGTIENLQKEYWNLVRIISEQLELFTNSVLESP